MTTLTAPAPPAFRTPPAWRPCEAAVQDAFAATPPELHLLLFSRLLAAMRRGGLDVAGQVGCIIDVVVELAEEGAQ